MAANRMLRLSYHRGLLCGVCGGIAQWLGWKPWIVRALFVLMTIFTAGFPGLLIYSILYLALPGPDLAEQPLSRHEPVAE